uniref:Lysosomal-associated membrane protein 2 n=1 Tax=Kryptolebias marmoratus TaxID=37003 RepID=A0A3Q2ZCN4_KRYMA
IEVNVTEDKKLCLYADLMLKFSVSYEISRTVLFALPENATSDGSKCDPKNSILKLNFGAGNSWSVNFIPSVNSYQADQITFSYNLKTITVSQNASIKDVEMDTCYSCKSKEVISADQVNMTLWNVLIQAFVTNGSKSENSKCRCRHNNETCLLADFGLRIGFKLNQKYQEMNFNPDRANVSGSCGVNSSELVLVSDEMTITFTFVNVSNLQVFNESSTNLSLWETNVGSSYMCNKEQNATISERLNLYTFNLRVQPFGVKKGVFSTAYECSLDDPSILIPIIVGAALAGLILIVVIAYLIGRRKTHAGYQTL